MMRPSTLDLAGTDVVFSAGILQAQIVIPDSIVSANIAGGTCLITAAAGVANRITSFNFVSKSGGLIFVAVNQYFITAGQERWFVLEDNGKSISSGFFIEGVSASVHVPPCGFFPVVTGQDVLNVEVGNCQVGDSVTNLYFRLTNIEWAV